MANCPKCTLFNPAGTARCEACGHIFGIECQSCTYLNPPGERHCLMCSANICQCETCRYERGELNLNDLRDMMIDEFVSPYSNWNINHDLGFTMEQIKTALQKYFRSPMAIPSNCIEAYVTMIQDRLDSNADSICLNLLIPCLRDFMLNKMVAVDAIEQAVVERWTMDQASKPNPASNDVVSFFEKLPIQESKESTCFCAGDDCNEVTLPCCGNNVHLHCIKKWFKENGTCPYCRNDFKEYVEADKTSEINSVVSTVLKEMVDIVSRDVARDVSRDVSNDVSNVQVSSR